jgi:hypothetical protein
MKRVLDMNFRERERERDGGKREFQERAAEEKV